MTPSELASDLSAIDGLDQVNVWLARGDGVAVYEASALDRSDLGSRKYVSFGSSTAQLEVDMPPTTLPDIGNQINWQYQLKFVYRGEPLQVPA